MQKEKHLYPDRMYFYPSLVYSSRAVAKIFKELWGGGFNAEFKLLALYGVLNCV